MSTEATDALRLFDSDASRFDIVITDLLMPKMTGVELVRAMKKVRFDIPVILLSGWSKVIDEDQNT